MNLQKVDTWEEAKNLSKNPELDAHIEYIVGQFEPIEKIAWVCPSCLKKDKKKVYLIPLSKERYTYGITAKAYCPECHIIFKFNPKIEVDKSAGLSKDNKVPEDEE